MFFVEAAGTPYEIGHQTGQATRLAVGSTVDLLAKGFRHWDEPRFRRARDRHMRYTEERCPELVEEVRGLADGVCLPFWMMYMTSFYACMAKGSEGCSNFIFTDTPDGPLLAKTNDLPVHDGKHSMIRLIRPADGPAVLCSSWIGTVWRGAAVNELGLAMGGSSCSASVPEPEEFMTPHAIGHYVLHRAGTVAEAIEVLEGVRAGQWGANWALADAGGDAAIVEKAGGLQAVRKPGDDRLWCTNHGLAPEFVQRRVGTPEALAESMARYKAIDRLTAGRPLTAALARDVAAYAEQPGALCRYGDVDPVKYETEFACVLAPARGRMDFCFSHADRDPWYTANLSASGFRRLGD